MKTKYQPGDMINSKTKLSLRVQSFEAVSSVTKGEIVIVYHVSCEKCGHIFKIPTKSNILEKRQTCPGCENKPAALKTDHNRNCVTICRMGQLEYIHRLITEEGMTQQGAVESFIEAVQAHANEGDPLTNDLTVEMVRSQYRRDSGKLNEIPSKSLVEPTKVMEAPIQAEPSDNSKVKKKTKYNCLPTVSGVQDFLDEYLPGYKIVEGGIA